MKKFLFGSILFALIAIMVSLTSCDRLRGTRSSGETSNVTFNLSAHTPSAKQTKSANITRYIVEIYKTSDPSTVVKRVEQATGTIVVSLDNNTNYVCLFWADGVALNDNTSGTYNATNLKNVTLNTGKEMGEAFFARLDITDATTTFNITLKRPIAKVSFIATDVVAANTDLVVTFNQHNGFNAFTSEVVGTAVSTSKTFNSAVTTGALGTLFTFASVVGIVSDFTAVYSTSTTNVLPSIPLRANYLTNIRGKYAVGSQDFTVIIVVGDNWANEVGGVEINVGTSGSPKWIKVADRNADKNGPNGATAGNTATDYGYYYQWSNADNDPTNVDKSYQACFNFAEGRGTWRLATNDEWIAIVGNGGTMHTDNANRKIQWEDPDWKLYDERAGQTSNFVILPKSGYSGNSGPTGSLNVGSHGYYWTNISQTWISLISGGYTNIFENTSSTIYGISVRCVRDVY